MNQKICIKCNTEKNISEFKLKSDGYYRGSCNQCRIEYSRKYYLEKGREKLKSEEYRRIKRERDKINAKKYREKNKEKISKSLKEKRKNNSEKFKKRSKESYLKNREKRIKNQKEYYQNNREKSYISKRAWVERNKDKVDAYQKEYRKKYYNDNKEKIYKRQEINRKKQPHKRAWRSILNNTIKRMNKKKEGKTIDLLGYSALELKEHMQSLFREGMAWDNYGEWHVDHIKPLCSFPPDTPINVVNALSNLQPLWAHDNLRKNKY